MSFKSENEVTESLDSDQGHMLPIPSETANTEQHAKRSLIGKAVHIKGDFSAREDIVINGRLDGTIALKMNKLDIGVSGFVQANVFAKTVIVSGEIRGDLYASEQVVITKTGRVIGDIYTAADVSIEDGAYIKGNVDMQKQDVFKQHAIPDMQEEHHSKGSGFGFLFKKNRDVTYTETMLLPDLRENSDMADEIASIPVDINPGIAPSTEQSVIGDTVVIKGELTAEEDVIIQGHLNGVVYFKNSSLGVGAQAEIKANVFVKSMVHHGKLEGDIYASEQVSIKKPGHVFGKIFAPRVSTEKGAVIMGSIEMEAQDIEKIYEKFHGAAEATLMTDVTPEASSAGDEDLSGQGSMQGKNTAWPIFYPRT